MIKEECKNKAFRITNDFGNSILRIKYIQYTLIYDRIANKDFEAHKTLLHLFTEKYLMDLALKKFDDNEPFQTLLYYLKKYLKTFGPSSLTKEDKRFFVDNLLKLLNTKSFM